MDGLNFLEKMMEHVNPGVGYVVLAYLLNETQHNVVITTNFDHLTEDAVNYYSYKIPLIIGHESLAHYITEQITRPTIIKIHRDLLFDPKNTVKDVAELHEIWKKALGMLFEEYHPVFIGYAGNDKSLMDFLVDNSDKFKEGMWKFPYWTLYNSDTPEGKVKDFLEAAEGYCINCNGFDELMCLIGAELGYKMPQEEDFLKDAKSRYKKLSGDFTKIMQKQALDISENKESDGKELKQAVHTITSKMDSFSKSDQADSLEKKGKYEEALKLRKELVEEESENAWYHAGLGYTLWRLGKYEKARVEYEKAVKLEPENALYHALLGKVLGHLKKYEEARTEYEKAIELDFGEDCFHFGLGEILELLEKHEEAREEYEKAVELSPETQLYRDSLAEVVSLIGEK